jgi:hypothetical protein
MFRQPWRDHLTTRHQRLAGARCEGIVNLNCIYSGLQKYPRLNVSSGQIADIIAVDDNPITNINNLGLLRFVMKEGIVFKNNL